MAQWCSFELRWTSETPSEIELHDLNYLLGALDYDFPELGASGVFTNWRAPSITLEATLAVIHAFGFPCHGRLRQLYNDDTDSEVEHLPWVDSKDDLTVLCERDFMFLLDATSRLEEGLSDSE